MVLFLHVLAFFTQHKGIMYQNIAARMATIRQVLDLQLDLLDHNTVTLRNYKLVQRYHYFTHFAIHYSRHNTRLHFAIFTGCRLPTP
jgi:hypothetical protein